MAEKTCSKCLVSKALECFAVNKMGRFGKASRCRDCMSILAREKRLANYETFRAREVARYTAGYRNNKQAYIERSKRWKQRRRDYYLAQQRDARQANLEEIRKKNLAWYYKNREHVLQRKASWRKQNMDAVKAYDREWDKKFGARKRAWERARKLKATPPWADKSAIKAIYDFARLRTQSTGIQWEVDHIVPLKSPIVCGLHTEHNLMVITKSMNSSKNNHYWPDMPERTSHA